MMPFNCSYRNKNENHYALEERSDDKSDSDEEQGQFAKFQSTLSYKLRATDPRYVTHADDYLYGRYSHMCE